MSFMLFSEYTKNLDKLKGEHRVFKATGTK